MIATRNTSDSALIQEGRNQLGGGGLPVGAGNRDHQPLVVLKTEFHLSNEALALLRQRPARIVRCVSIPGTEHHEVKSCVESALFISEAFPSKQISSGQSPLIFVSES